MQFQYVPIIRRRQAELGALMEIDERDLDNIVPLIELCEQILPERNLDKLRAESLPNYIWSIIRAIAAAIGDRHYFIDANQAELTLIRSGHPHPLQVYFELLDYHGLHASPVVAISSSLALKKEVADLVRKYPIEICIRISKTELMGPILAPGLTLLLKQIGLNPGQVHLHVDLADIQPDTPSLRAVCKRVPMLSAWRSFTIGAGSFPTSLAEIPKHSEYEIDRFEWLNWAELIRTGSDLERLPTFSDYAIQSGVRPKRIDFVPNVSASIRYALPDRWVIMRGEGLRNPDGAGFDQYWGLANSLIQRKEFEGPLASAGDSYIFKMGNQTTHSGTPRTWLQAGLNRHLTLTSREVSRLMSSARLLDPETKEENNIIPIQRRSRSRLTLPQDYRQGPLWR